MLTLTRKGVADARKVAAKRGMDPAQQIRFAPARPAQAAHDAALYRAYRKEREPLRKQGATVRRIRLDTELKSAVARRSEAARLKDGKRAADAERHRAARELGLPVDDAGQVLYPDAQIEYADAEGRTGRVNVEAVSANYREPARRGGLAQETGSRRRRRPLVAPGTRRARSGHGRTLTTTEESAMQPWRISAGLTAAIAGSTFLVAGSHLEYLGSFRPLILADHGLSLTLNVGLALTTFAAAVYGVARATGLADLGRRVDLAERSVRRGEGDPGLTDALRRDAEGDWE